jgi:hypothetical protein
MLNRREFLRAVGATVLAPSLPVLCPEPTMPTDCCYWLSWPQSVVCTAATWSGSGEDLTITKIRAWIKDTNLC